MRTSESQRGFAHIIAIIAVVIIIGALGFVGWQTFSKKVVEDTVNSTLTAAAKQECEKKNDKDICKFVTSWSASSKYKSTTTDPTGATSFFEIDGDKSHMKTTSAEFSYEVITIDKTTYTKGGDYWYKQTTSDPETTVETASKPEFKEPAEDSSDQNPEEDKTSYKLIGKEACGKLTCFHYQVIDASNIDSQEYIWFDDSDYKLRKSTSQTSEGKFETVFEYDTVTVSVPSPVKELGSNQYIMPGTGEVVTMPSAEQ